MDALEQTLQTKHLKKALPHKTPYGERLSVKVYQEHTLKSEISRKDTNHPPTKQNKETNLFLCNTVLLSSSKS